LQQRIDRAVKAERWNGKPHPDTRAICQDRGKLAADARGIVERSNVAPTLIRSSVQPAGLERRKERVAKAAWSSDGCCVQHVRTHIRRQLKRRYVLAFFQKLTPCLVGIEACASSHHWSRELHALGHTVRLMPPAYVKRRRVAGKTDPTIVPPSTV
jgi:hypothetical protein